MKVIAHRGNNKESLENSYAAFNLAVSCGAVRIELDVQMTKDGHGVINHDDHLIHTTGKNLFCSQLDKKDFSKIKLLNGEAVPFLDDVIEQFLPKIELNLEIKGNGIEPSKKIIQLLEKNTHRDKVIVSSFCLDPLLYIKNNAPDIQRACLVGDDALPWPFFSHLSPLNFMNDVAATIIHPRFDMIGESFMDQARSRGWQVYTWATMIGEDIARESVWTVLSSLGVDGHCTNYPRELILWLKESNLYDSKIKPTLIHSSHK
jgi:glycerophosphoryl diester phosphodiesterase